MNRKKSKSKALVLLSGGLDSRLVCKILKGQLGKERVEALFLKLPFGGGCCNDEFCVLRFAQTEGVKLHVLDCTKGRMFRRYIEMIKNPKFQRGVELNPCIDCHIFMLKEAKKLAKRTGARIIATGEVLGERPMSQNKRSMELIEREAGIQGKILRPLSAKLLPETDAEKKGWINRDKLLDIQGRSRKRQIALAKRYRISYPSPAGGCLLTDPEFARRLRDILEHSRKLTEGDVALLKLGRHFRQGKSKIIVGRKERENKQLLRIAGKLKTPWMEAGDYMGPVTLVRNPTSASLRTAARLTARYSDAPKGKAAKIKIKTSRGQEILKARALPEAKIAKLRV